MNSRTNSLLILVTKVQGEK